MIQMLQKHTFTGSTVGFKERYKKHMSQSVEDSKGSASDERQMLQVLHLASKQICQVI